MRSKSYVLVFNVWVIYFGLRFLDSWYRVRISVLVRVRLSIRVYHIFRF